MEILIYLSKVNFCWIILYACFWLFFRRHTFFKLNRFYLLGTLLLAIFLPMLTIPESATQNIPDVVYSISVSPVLQRESQIRGQNMEWTGIIFMIYLAGVIFMFFNMLKGLMGLFFFIRKGETIRFEDHTLVLLPEIATSKMGSFSFFKWLVVSQGDYENCFENVLKHEMVHIRQKHSVDIIIVELLKILFWFNPVLWLYKISMQQIHEFLADTSATDRENYATFLISYSFNAPIVSLSNPFFNSSLLKSRIKMMFKNRTPRWLATKYIMVLPLLGLTIVLTSSREQLQEISDFGAKIIENRSSEDVENAVDNQGKFNLPLSAKIDKKAGPIKSDTIPGKVILDRNAYFQNGFRGTENYFYSQMKYPLEALVENIQGTVRVSFIVNENGDIRDAQIVDGLGYGIDEEALRVVENMPNWHSAIKNGEPVSVRVTMGIDFYPALAGGRRKSDIEIRNESYNTTPKLAAQTAPFLTISEIGKRLNRSPNFSDANIPRASLFRYGYTMSRLALLPPIKMINDSVDVQR